MIQTVFFLPQQEHSQPRTSPQSRGSCGSAIGDDCDSADLEVEAVVSDGVACFVIGDMIKASPAAGC